MTAATVEGKITHIDESYYIVVYVVDGMPERVRVRRDGSSVDSKGTFQFNQKALDQCTPEQVDLSVFLGESEEVWELQRVLRTQGIWTAADMAKHPSQVRDAMARAGVGGSHAILINQVKHAKTVNEEE